MQRGLTGGGWGGRGLKKGEREHPLGHDLVNPKAFLSDLVPKVSLALFQKVPESF